MFVNAVEALEDPIEIDLGQPASVVGDDNDDVRVLAFDRHTDRARVGVLDRVADHVGQHLHDSVAVATDYASGASLEDQVELFGLGLGREQLNHLGRELADVDRV